MHYICELVQLGWLILLGLFRIDSSSDVLRLFLGLNVNVLLVLLVFIVMRRINPPRQ